MEEGTVSLTFSSPCYFQSVGKYECEGCLLFSVSDVGIPGVSEPPGRPHLRQVCRNAAPEGPS